MHRWRIADSSIRDVRHQGCATRAGTLHVLASSSWRLRSPKQPTKEGHSRKPEEFRKLIIQIAKETGWGYKHIVGELKKEGIRNISRATG